MFSKNVSIFTVLVVCTFLICWSPYQLIHMWYFIDRSTASNVNLLVQEILFIFGVSSSVIDPYVYGFYSMGLWKDVRKRSSCFHGFRRADNPNDSKRHPNTMTIGQPWQIFGQREDSVSHQLTAELTVNGSNIKKTVCDVTTM